MDLVKNDADAASPSASDSRTQVALGTNALAEGTSDTPVGIKSSPPPISIQAMEGSENGDASPLGAKSDSEAETVVLPGANGHSPSKIRREGRAIKLEDKANESGMPDIDAENHDEIFEEEGAVTTELATSTLGKRKRSKHGNTRNEHSHNGHSSGLSSVPTSPVATTRSSLSKPAESDSDVSKSPSPRIGQKEKAKSVDGVVPKVETDTGDYEKESRRFRRQQSSGGDQSGQRNKRSGESQSSRGENNTRKRTRSPSPHSRSHRRSVSSTAPNGTIHKKKRIPAPLRATRESLSVDQHSDSSSSPGESPHPRRSRTRNVITPPTGDSSVSLNKMGRGKNAHHRTSLMNACDRGNLESAKQFLRENPGDLDVADPEGNTPLQCASLNGHAEVVKMLLDAGCNVHTLNNERDSPLLDAVENGHLEVVKLLIAAGVNPKQRNRAGHEPIDKIREDADDYDEIQAELKKARDNWIANANYTRPSVPVQSPHPERESSSARNRRTQSHGRSTKTGDNLLYTSYNVDSLRSAAAIGDLEKVGTILQVLTGSGNFDDPEALIAAARGGHDEVVQIMLGFAGMNPDPPPLKNKDWDHATPMLAAIGGDCIKVIELLLQQVQEHKFDPSRVYDGMTYPEWARHCMGPGWQEEERILQKAFDEYKKPTNHKSSSSTNSPTRTHQKRLSDPSGRSGGTNARDQSIIDAHGRKRGVSPSSNSTTAKRGPGRPRKEGRETSDTHDRESVSSASHKERVKPRRSDSDNVPTSPEIEPTKPRRKLISGREMKGERDRRASIASVGSVLSPAGEHGATQVTKNSTPRLTSNTTDLDIGPDRITNRTRKEGDSRDRIAAMREDSPAKRSRNSMTPPPTSPKGSDHGLANKRRRIESTNRGEARHSSSPDRKSLLGDTKRPLQHGSDKNLESDHNRGLESKIKVAKPNSPSPEEKMAAEQKLLAEREKAELDAKRAADEEAARILEEEAERQRAEEVRLEIQRREELEIAERLAREEEERVRKQHEREVEMARREEEAKQRQLELERQRQEEREQRQREIERLRQARIQEREEEKRRKEKEEEESRLAKLPPLLRWFDGLARPATSDVASRFTTLQGVRYDTIRPEASGSLDAREQWLLNTHVALLLGEKDLHLSRYTAWEHIPVSNAAKHVLWGVESDRYAMFDSAIQRLNPESEFRWDEATNSFRPPPVERLEKLRSEARSLFWNLELSFVKLSDFLSVIHLHPHLRNIRLKVYYRELPPPGWPIDQLVFPSKWKGDQDAGPFTPGPKTYVNGNLFDVAKQKFSQVSDKPFNLSSEDRVPRRDLRQVFPHHADYEQLCAEQGLSHLLPGGVGNGTPFRNGVTPPDSSASTNEENRRLSDAVSVAGPTQDLPNGVMDTS